LAALAIDLGLFRATDPEDKSGDEAVALRARRVRALALESKLARVPGGVLPSLVGDTERRAGGALSLSSLASLGVNRGRSGLGRRGDGL